jgi:hypothetical protein
MASLYNKSFGTTGALGYENPAFKISIVSPNDELQQKQGNPRPNPAGDYQDNLEVGSVVSFTIGKIQVVGKISRIFKNAENDTVFVEVKTNSGKKYKVDSSRVNSKSPAFDNVPDNVATNLSTSGIFAEGRFHSFDKFAETI